MEVDVIKLREFGRKLPQESIREAKPLHGFLELAYWHLKNGREDRQVRELVVTSAPNASCQPMATLVGAQLTRLKGDEMVYIGTETIDGVEYAHAWWCRLAPRSPGG